MNENNISQGTQNAIAQFEAALVREEEWAKQAVLYEVEKVLDRRKCAGAEAPRYLVKWSGYDEQSWTPMESLEGCYGQLLKDYALLKRPRGGGMGMEEVRRREKHI